MVPGILKVGQKEGLVLLKKYKGSMTYLTFSNIYM